MGVVLGGFNPPGFAIGSYYWNEYGTKPNLSVGKIEEVQLMEDGSPYINTQSTYIDPMVRELWDCYAGRQTKQGAGRFRPIHCDKPKTLIVMSDAPLERNLRPSMLVNIKSICPGVVVKKPFILDAVKLAKIKDIGFIQKKQNEMVMGLGINDNAYERHTEKIEQAMNDAKFETNPVCYYDKSNNKKDNVYYIFGAEGRNKLMNYLGEIKAKKIKFG